MSITDTNIAPAEVATGIIKETDAALEISSGGYSPEVRDALNDYSAAIGDALAVADQCGADLAELADKSDLVPMDGWNRLRREAIEDAEKLAREADRRAEAAQARLVASLQDDALPVLDPAREVLARQELALILDGASGGGIQTRVMTIATDGSPEVQAVLLRTQFGKTILASRGLAGRELQETMSSARSVVARFAPERGATEKQRKAGTALLKLGRLGGARTAARVHLRTVAESVKAKGA
jgi:hypothetical protein